MTCSSTYFRVKVSKHFIIKLILYSFLIAKCLAESRKDRCKPGKEVCKNLDDCPTVLNNIQLYIDANAVPFCYQDGSEDEVCCPLPVNQRASIDSLKKADNRILVKKCAEYNEKLSCANGTPFIIGGQKAEPKEFPHMALLGEKVPGKQPDFYCGGTLISSKFVVTASHCLQNKALEDLVVRLGELDYSTTEDIADPKDFNLTNAIPHPSNDSLSYDIALLELEREVEFNDFIKPACLAWDDGSQFETFVAAGWGQVSQRFGSNSPHLQKTVLKKYKESRCEELYKQHFNKDLTLCVGAETSDTCNGDSGGPLFVKHPQYRCLYVLVGVVSQGIICGIQDHPALYTRVNLFTEWIERLVWDSAVPLNKLPLINKIKP